jgi:capsular polysaccharide export protein
VQVQLHANGLASTQTANGQPRIDIANHGHPLDVLLVQGYFRMCSMTTAANHLRFLLPLFRRSAANYGHIHLNHLSASSRLAGLRKLMQLLKQRNHLFLFPSGSLMTPITERVSGSLYLLTRLNNAVIIPWVFKYEDFPSDESEFHYRPLLMIRARLFGPKAVIHCQQGDPINVQNFSEEQSLRDHIQSYYRQHLKDP